MWSPIQWCSSHSQEITQEEIQLANLNFMQVMRIWQSFLESSGYPLSIVLSISKFDTSLHSPTIHSHEMGILTGIAPAHLDPIEVNIIVTGWRDCTAHNLVAFPLIKQASVGSVAAEHTWTCWQCKKRSVHTIQANSRFAISDDMPDMAVKEPTKKMDALSSSHFLSSEFPCPLPENDGKFLAKNCFYHVWVPWLKMAPKIHEADPLPSLDPTDWESHRLKLQRSRNFPARGSKKDPINNKKRWTCIFI